MFEKIIAYLPYVVILGNAVLSCLTYKRTGKITKRDKTGQEIVDEDLQGLIDYHKRASIELEKKLKK